VENGSDSVVAEDERRVHRMSRALMCRLRYDGVEVVRTLNVNTANLYEIRCLTGSQCKWWEYWYVIALAPVKRPELRCFGQAEACRQCYRWEGRGAERCSSRVLIGPGYRLASVRVPSSAGDVCGGWPVYGNCTTTPLLVERKTPIEKDSEYLDLSKLV